MKYPCFGHQNKLDNIQNVLMGQVSFSIYKFVLICLLYCYSPEIKSNLKIRIRQPKTYHCKCNCDWLSSKIGWNLETIRYVIQYRFFFLKILFKRSLENHNCQIEKFSMFWYFSVIFINSKMYRLFLSVIHSKYVIRLLGDLQNFLVVNQFLFWVWGSNK